MDMTTLELYSPAPGVGYLKEIEAQGVSLSKVMDGLRPVAPDWQSRILDMEAKGEAVFLPRGFAGWTFEDEETPRFLVFYHSLEHLSAALAKGHLVPAGGRDRLTEFGLVNSRGSVTPSHLRKNRRLLGAMGLHPIARIAGTRAFATEQVPGGPLRLFQQMTGEAWEGKLVAVFVPALARRRDGTILTTAKWLASATQVSRAGRAIRRPLLYFDGMRLNRVADLTRLPDFVREDFDKSGEVALVEQAILCAPLLFRPTHLISCDTRWKSEALEAKDGKTNSFPEPVQSREAFLLPVFSMPNAPHDVPALQDREAAAALRQCTLHPSREKLKSLPHGYYTNCDFYLCQRRYPGLAIAQKSQAGSKGQ